MEISGCQGLETRKEVWGEGGCRYEGVASRWMGWWLHEATQVIKLHRTTCTHRQTPVSKSKCTIVMQDGITGRKDCVKGTCHLLYIFFFLANSCELMVISKLKVLKHQNFLVTLEKGPMQVRQKPKWDGWEGENWLMAASNHGVTMCLELLSLLSALFRKCQKLKIQINISWLLLTINPNCLEHSI